MNSLPTVARASFRPADARHGPSRILHALALHAANRPESCAASRIDPDGSPADGLSFAALENLARRLAIHITDIAEQGRTVLLMGPHCPRFVAWICAGLYAGVRVLCVHPRSTEAEIRALARQTSAGAMIAPRGALLSNATSLRQVEFNSAPCSSSHAAPLLGGAILLQSSGSTDVPRIVLRESDALDADAANVAHAVGLTPDDRILTAVPLSHSYGIDFLLASILAGASLHIMEEFDAPAFAAHLGNHATVLPGVPFMFEAAARIAPALKPARLRLAFSAGAPIASRVRKDFRRAWSVKVGDLYGASELGSVTLNDPASALFAAGSVGVPMQGVDIRILDPIDPSRRLRAGEEGHVAVYAPSMFTGYIGAEAPIFDGHFLTGDLGRIDDRGRLYITGRLRLLIESGGFKVNPLEVEAVLSSHPGVAECIVVALPVSDTVMRLRALYIPRPSIAAPDASELRRFLRERLAPHKVPRVFESVVSLPRSVCGKLQRHSVPPYQCQPIDH